MAKSMKEAVDKIKNEVVDNHITGTVKWFNSTLGYGFIKGDDGNDYYAHTTRIDVGVPASMGLAVGSKVTFTANEPGKDGKEKIATNIVMEDGIPRSTLSKQLRSYRKKAEAKLKEDPDVKVENKKETKEKKTSKKKKK